MGTLNRSRIAPMPRASVDRTKHFAILSEAKDLFFHWCTGQRILRFAQNDKWVNGVNLGIERRQTQS